MSTRIITDPSDEVKSDDQPFTPVSVEDLQVLLDTVNEHCGAKYLMVHRNYVKSLKGDGSAAILLAYYLNEFRMKTSSDVGKKAVAKNGSWFKSMSVTVHEQIGMSSGRVKRCAEVLVQCGAISIRHWRGNAVWVKINADNLDKLRPRINGTQNQGNPDSRINGTPILESMEPRFSLNKNCIDKKTTKEMSASADDPPSVEQRSSLLPKSITVDPQCESLAKQLKEALHRNNRTCRGSIKTSAEGLRLLRDVDKQTHCGKVVIALAGCCSREEQERLGLPHVENGHQIRKHFEWIVSRLVKGGKLDPNWDERATPEKIPVSPVVTKLVTKLSNNLSWPKGASLQLGPAVQTSIDNYKRFRSKFFKFIDTTTDQTLKRLAEHLAFEFTKPSMFIEEWFTDFHKSVDGWEEWSGNLTLFSETAPRFIKMGATLTDNYCGDADRWTRLLKAVKEVAE